MSLKQKASALGVLAAVAIGCLTAANASATSGGHFVITPETSHSIIFGTQTEKHRLEYALHGLEGGIICDSALYEGTAEAATVTQLDLKPTYSGCHTTGSSTNIPIDVNGCFYRLTVAKGSTDQSEQTVHLVCPFGNPSKSHIRTARSQLRPRTVSAARHTQHSSGSKIPTSSQ
jgi:hypothetical protein